MTDDVTHPLKPVVTAWEGRLTRARTAKKPFDEQAAECMKFYCGPQDHLWSADKDGAMWTKDMKGLPPAFRMQMNKAFEMVAIYGPYLYHDNPVRMVTPRKQFMIPPEAVGNMTDPNAIMAYQAAMMGVQSLQVEDNLRAELMSAWLNYTPNELNLAHNFKKAINEALIKGRGVLWTEVYQPPGSTRVLTGSFYDSVDYLQVDPDAESMDEALWIARKRCHPFWVVEQRFGLEQGTLERYGHLESADHQGEVEFNEHDKNYERSTGEAKDLIEYWEIWSKMGIGARTLDKDIRDKLDHFGDYCYLAIADNIPFPLNLPDEKAALMTPEQIMEAVSWETPFWRDTDWPVTVIDFYHEPGSVWPIAPLKPGIGELKFLNWAMSYLADRIRISSREFIAVAKSAAQKIKDDIANGGDLTVLEIEEIHQNINNVVQFLQHNPVNKDIWDIVAAVSDTFDKRSGLSEVLYGIARRQDRSAAESAIKEQNSSVRPDYMAKVVEESATRLCRKEALATRFHIESQDVQMALGPMASSLWGRLINDQDVDKVMGEMEYRIEAGSARKPNKDREVQNVMDAIPIWGPIVDKHADATGDTNALNALISQWGRAVDQDVSGILMGPRVPPMPPPMDPNMAPPPEEMAA